jgi:hypothetical protein
MERIKEGDVRAVVVATTSGASALAVAEAMPKGVSVYGISHQPTDRVDPEIKEKAQALGAVFLPDEPAVMYLKDIDGHVPDAFRRLGQGMKVAIEVAMQAVETGFIDPGTGVISLGGSSKGIDTAIVIKASGPQSFSDVWVSEILAKPK